MHSFKKSMLQKKSRLNKSRDSEERQVEKGNFAASKPLCVYYNVLERQVCRGMGWQALVSVPVMVNAVMFCTGCPEKQELSHSYYLKVSRILDPALTLVPHFSLSLVPESNRILRGSKTNEMDTITSISIGFKDIHTGQDMMAQTPTTGTDLQLNFAFRQKPQRDKKMVKKAEWKTRLAFLGLDEVHKQSRLRFSETLSHRIFSHPSSTRLSTMGAKMNLPL